MAIPIPHKTAVRHYKPHPYAHHVGFVAALIGMLSIPLGLLIFPPLLAIALGMWAILLSLHPAPGLNARPEGWAAVIMGLMGLAFGIAQLTFSRFV
jgi:hypothetical protein